MGAGHVHTLYVHEHSLMHRLPPEIKVLGLTLYVVAVAMTPRGAVWAFAIYATGVVTLTAVSRIPGRFVLTRLVAIVPFVLFAVLLPFIGSGATTEVAGLSLSVEGMWAMWNILAKATIGASASILLSATTEVPDILKGLSRLRVPPVLTSIASFMIRYLEVIAGELSRMRTAMTARGYDPRWIGQARPIAASAGALFIRSYERGERVYDAMVARGYNGSMPILNSATATPALWARSMSIPLAALAVAVIAVVIT